MVNKKHLFALAVLLVPYLLFSQDTNRAVRSLSMGYTTTSESLEETRLSFRERVDLGFTTSIRYATEKPNRRQSIDLRFGKNFSTRDGGLSRFRNLKPSVVYTYERPLKDFYLGGFVDAGALLSFPSSWRGNNTISYTIWGSLGLSAAYARSLPYNENHKFFSRLRLPLLNYVVRPAYGLPYPEGFLEEDVFDFQRTNMGRYVLTSGNIQSPGQFQHLFFELGYTLPLFGERFELGVSYVLEYLQVSTGKTVQQTRHGAQLFWTYNFNRS